MSLFTQQRNEFKSRHIGPHQEATAAMLTTIGEPSLDSLIDKTVPNAIRMKSPLNLPAPMHEAAYLQHVQEMGNKNIVAKNFIGQGYYGTYTPSVILRTIFENPGWYTQYTPYQAEIAQGRLESLLNYQTMVSDLTGLPIANASLLDEATAASEAMTMFFNMLNKNQDSIERPKFFVDQHCFPQTIDVLKTRALPIGIELEVGDYKTASLDATYFGALVQYPNDKGSVESYEDFIHQVHQVGAYVAMATDLLALTLLKSPGELGADVALGSAQRFGVPMGFGGPHAAFFAVSDEFKRQIPGRIIGISIDANGNRALRMALQTREQHIKREKATSNICTAQALLANMAAMYAVYHGPQGLKAIATRIQQLTTALATSLKTVAPSVITVENANAFDTLLVHVPTTKTIAALANAANINFRYFNDTQIGISLDETTSMEDVNAILCLFAKAFEGVLTTASIQEASMIPAALQRNKCLLNPSRI